MTGAPAPPIDVAAGLARMTGHQPLYLRMLARFRDEYTPLPGAIRAALALHDSETAQRLAHTLKGASGMIEAVALQEAALGLERLLHAGASDCSRQVELLEAELGRVMRAIGDELG